MSTYPTFVIVAYMPVKKRWNAQRTLDGTFLVNGKFIGDERRYAELFDTNEQAARASIEAFKAMHITIGWENIKYVN